MSGRGYTTKLEPEDFYLAAVGAGKIPGMSHNNWNATRGAVGTSALDTVVDWGTFSYPPDDGDTVSVASDSASDTGSIVVYGLDEEWLEKSQTVTLNGTTPVALDGQWARVNEIIARDELTGDVTASGVNGAYLVAYAEYQRSLSGVFSVPANKSAYITLINAGIVKTSGGSASTLEYRLQLRRGAGPFGVPYLAGLSTTGTSSHSITNGVPEPIPGPADLQWIARATAASTSVYIRTSVLLEEK